MRQLNGHFYHVTCLVLFDLGTSLPTQFKSEIIVYSSSTDCRTPPSCTRWCKTRWILVTALFVLRRVAWNSNALRAARSGSIQLVAIWMECILNWFGAIALWTSLLPVPLTSRIEMPWTKSTFGVSFAIIGALRTRLMFSSSKNMQGNCKRRSLFWRRRRMHLGE